VALLNPIVPLGVRAPHASSPRSRRSVAPQTSRTATAEVRLFEIGSVFGAPGGSGERPEEHEHVAAVFASDGDDAATAVNAWWCLVEGLGLDQEYLSIDQPAPGAGPLADPLALGCHPTRSGLVRARTTIGDEVVAVVVRSILWCWSRSRRPSAAVGWCWSTPTCSRVARRDRPTRRR